MTTLDFAPNYNHVIELDITPNETYRTWEYALYGATNCDPTPNETSSDETYYHNLGSSEKEITAVSWSIAISAHRCYGNALQDFIAGLVNSTGKLRKTNYRWTWPDGTYLEGTCTISDIKPGMGAPNDKGDFQFTISLNTIDVYEAPGNVDVPTSITCSAVSVAAGATAEVSPTVTPSTANQKCHFGIEDTTIATVDSDGVVTGVAAGETNLTVKAASMPSVTKTVKVTVTAASPSQGSGGGGNS